ncbi:hypothetical protein Tco_0339645 [Tanacetum coccineum]
MLNGYFKDISRIAKLRNFAIQFACRTKLKDELEKLWENLGPDGFAGKHVHTKVAPAGRSGVCSPAGGIGCFDPGGSFGRGGAGSYGSSAGVGSYRDRVGHRSQIGRVCDDPGYLTRIVLSSLSV